MLSTLRGARAGDGRLREPGEVIRGDCDADTLLVDPRGTA
jgi:hypothetical protein